MAKPSKEHLQRLADMLRQVSPDGDVAEMDSAPTDDVKTAFKRSTRSLSKDSDQARNGLRALVGGRPEDLSSDQAIGLEAIVLPRYRPVIDVINGDFHTPPNPWTHLGSATARENLVRVIPSIGRIEVPKHPKLPYAGTGFVVGEGIIMTNRHVAEIFATGLGRQEIEFQSGQSASMDFRREVVPSAPVLLEVDDVLMIHPQFDMALLRVRGLSNQHPILTLDVSEPRDLAENDVVVIGYPAQDPRNDQELQNQVFRGIYDVKRIQPGKLKTSQRIKDHYHNDVDTVTHDCSTLGGNSGSAVIDLETGKVIALHFAGKYLKANYAVPMRELAKDPRVAATEIKFSEQVPASDAWEKKWRMADDLPMPVMPTSNEATKHQPASKNLVNDVPMAARSGWNVPLEIKVAVGDRTVISKPVVRIPVSPTGHESIPLRIPKIYDGLENRLGYQADFLSTGNNARHLDIPKLTLRGRKVASKLDDGSFVLNYHKFSIIMHKHRRLAMLAAANVDYRLESRKVNDRRPSRRELTEIPKRFGEQWVTDPRIPHFHQLPDVFFSNDRGAFDKGHLVRRTDVCWGTSFEDIQKANGDTYHTTNCSPQVSSFNQASRNDDNWGRLEDFIQQQTNSQKAIVFSGPVFDEADPVFEGLDKHGQIRIPIPQSYWKVVVVRAGKQLEAFGFVLKQDLSDVDLRELAVPAKWERHQRSIHEIQQLTGRLFDMTALIEIDSLG